MVGGRYERLVEELASQVGRSLGIRQTPDQHRIKVAATELVGARVVKGPGYLEQSRQVTLTIDGPIAESELRRIRSEFTRRTGFSLVVSW